jgi:hypothetical protein
MALVSSGATAARTCPARVAAIRRAFSNWSAKSGTVTSGTPAASAASAVPASGSGGEAEALLGDVEGPVGADRHARREREPRDDRPPTRRGSRGASDRRGRGRVQGGIRLGRDPQSPEPPPPLAPDAPLARKITEVIRSGDAAELQLLIDEHPAVARVRIADPERGQSRTLLHVVTDWPGHAPEAGAKIEALVAAGADVDARFTGPHTETPLHWAASSDDVEALDALLDAGADIDAPGAVIGGGTPLDDAVAFGQWTAARRLLERGAHPKLWNAAALGLMDLLESELDGPTPPSADESPTPSGAPATAASGLPPSTCSRAAPISTGSATTT